jgi:hypothetical protein
VGRSGEQDRTERTFRREIRASPQPSESALMSCWPRHDNQCYTATGTAYVACRARTTARLRYTVDNKLYATWSRARLGRIMSIGMVESTADYSLPLPLDQGQSSQPSHCRLCALYPSHISISISASVLYRLFAICLPFLPPNIAVNTSHSLYNSSI